MQCANIFIAAKELAEATGWAFYDHSRNYVRVSGCRKATLCEGWAMALLQALHYAKEQGYKYRIYSHHRIWKNVYSLADRIKLLDENPVIHPPQEEEPDYYVQQLAQDAAKKILHSPRLSFEQVQTGQQLIQRQELFSQNYLVIAKFLASKTIALKNLSSSGKVISAWGQEQFEAGDFIEC